MEVCLVIHKGLFKAKFHFVNLAKNVGILWRRLVFFLPEWKLKFLEFIAFMRTFLQVLFESYSLKKELWAGVINTHTPHSHPHPHPCYCCFICYWSQKEAAEGTHVWPFILKFTNWFRGQIYGTTSTEMSQRVNDWMGKSSSSYLPLTVLSFFRSWFFSLNQFPIWGSIILREW